MLSLVTYLKTKGKRSFTLWVVAPILLITLAALEIASALPPQVYAFEKNSVQEVDGNFIFSFLGAVDESSVKISTHPEIAYQAKWSQGLTPLQHTLEIAPKSLRKPGENYLVSVQVRNWAGLATTVSKNFQTNTAPAPILVSPGNKTEKIPADSKIYFSLNRKLNKGTFILLSEPSFSYHDSWQGSTLVIKPNKNLRQGQTYRLGLFLKIDGKTLAPISFTNFTTISPLSLVSSSLKRGSTSVSKKAKLTFVFDKDINRSTLEKSWSIKPNVKGSLSLTNKKTVIFIPSTTLSTATTYIASFSTLLSAVDNSRLNSTFSLKFKTAGPVKVLSFSPSGFGASLGSTIAVNFDQAVNHISAQNHFSISPKVSGTFSWKGNSLYFKPQWLSFFTSYKISVSSGITSIGGETSKQSFSANFTTTSERSKTIGYSVLGRPVVATYFGIGPKKILLVGCLHGSECNTGAMLNSWMSYLRSNQSQLRTDRTFIIVPYANPDGRAANNRFNAHVVDLNRNFDASWQAKTYWLNQTYPHGGGSAPFSEPESRALRNLILAERPARIVSYHAAANLVVGFGIGVSFRNWYASKTGYAAGSGDVESFGYSITGTLEEWAQNQGYVTIVVEFASAYYNEYYRNLPALKGLLTLAL